MTSELKKAWNKEKANHLGDYGDSSEYDLECAFKAGWKAAKKDSRSAEKKLKEIRQGYAKAAKRKEEDDYGREYS